MILYVVLCAHYEEVGLWFWPSVITHTSLLVEMLIELICVALVSPPTRKLNMYSTLTSDLP